MKSKSINGKLRGRSSMRAVLVSIGIATLATSAAWAKVGIQMSDFFYNDGTVVLSDNGEPDDAVLNRFYDTQQNGINWQLMTQHLTRGVVYDVWLQGWNDGTPGSAFSWWLGRTKATPQGDLNAFGNVYVGRPPGPFTGWFSNSRAQANLVIKTTDGIIVQTALFPVF